MEDLNKNLAQNLKRIRKERDFSLDKVAALTGISKSMLGQIEREETNPTISTVWKIASGLKLPLTNLIENTLPNKMLIKKEDINPLYEDSNKVCSYLFFRNTISTNFEYMKVSFAKNSKLVSSAHISGTKEYIIVFNGVLTVCIDDDSYDIKAGDAFQFDADKDHVYLNKGDESVELAMLVYYT